MKPTGKWCISQNEEYFSSGEFDSKEEAIIEGREQYDGEDFYIAEETLIEMSDLHVDVAVSHMLDWIQQSAYDIVGEYAEEYPYDAICPSKPL